MKDAQMRIVGTISNLEEENLLVHAYKCDVI